MPLSQCFTHHIRDFSTLSTVYILTRTYTRILIMISYYCYYLVPRCTYEYTVVCAHSYARHSHRMSLGCFHAPKSATLFALNLVRQSNQKRLFTHSERTRPLTPFSDPDT